MADHGGYIKLWRKIYDHPLHPINRQREWSGLEALLDLIMRAWAGDEPKKIWKGNETIEIHRGQLDTTLRELRQRWRWSIGKVHSFLKHLETEKTITQKMNRWFTVITIENYDIYNPRNERKMNGKRTENERKMNTIEREAMKSNESNDLSPEKKIDEDSIQIKLAKLLFKLIQENNPKVKEPNIEKWALEIDYMLRLDSRTEKEIEFIICWAQSDPFWKTNILSTAKLREKFDQLWIKAKADFEKTFIPSV